MTDSERDILRQLDLLSYRNATVIDADQIPQSKPTRRRVRRRRAHAKKEQLPIVAPKQVEWHLPVVSVKLSHREKFVLMCLANGRERKEIAQLLNRTVKTVDRHIKGIKGKIGTSNLSVLTHYALRHEYISPIMFLIPNQ